MWQKVFENDAFCGIMHETAAEQKESRSPEAPADIVILFILMNQCGVDYTKAVVIIDEQKYIDSVKQPHIRPNEFDALRGKEYRIQCGMQKYIEKYKKAKLSEKETDKILVRCSTLQYFEEYL